MRKRWKYVVHAPTGPGVDYIVCCKKLKCFETCNESFLKWNNTSWRMHLECSAKLSFCRAWDQTDASTLMATIFAIKFSRKLFRFCNDMQRSVRSFPRLFLEKLADMNSTGVDQNSSSIHLASLPLSRSPIISYLEQTAKSCRERMLDKRQLHLLLSRKRYLHESFVNDYVGVHDGLPSECYFICKMHNHCNCIKMQTRRFPSYIVCNKFDNELWTANGSHQDTEDLRVYNRMSPR